MQEHSSKSKWHYIIYHCIQTFLISAQNSSLDQSVPLTPEGSGRISWHDSPNSSAVTVPGTPNQPAAVSVASPPL